MNSKDGMKTEHEICVISQLWPNASSSFEHSSFSKKAYTNLHETIPAINNITLLKLKKLFTIRALRVKKNGPPRAAAAAPAATWCT